MAILLVFWVFSVAALPLCTIGVYGVASTVRQMNPRGGVDRQPDSEFSGPLSATSSARLARP
jgi:hypothetical protein